MTTLTLDLPAEVFSALRRSPDDQRPFLSGLLPPSLFLTGSSVHSAWVRPP